MTNQKQLAQKIKKLRKSFGLSQEQFAKKVGLSRVAVSQLEIGKRGLEAVELAKIANVFDVSVDFLFHGNAQKTTASKTGKPKKQKTFSCDEEKLKHTILYVLEKCGGKPNVGETVLYKLLYFLDFDNYELFNKPITGMNYVKLQFGPVPQIKKYNPVIEQMISNKQLRIIAQPYHGKMQKRYVALDNCDIDTFKPSELQIIDSVVARLSDMSARQIEDYVHEDAPWQATKNQEVIDYDLVFYRGPKFCKRDYHREMQNSAAGDYLEHESISEKEYDYYEHL